MNAGEVMENEQALIPKVHSEKPVILLGGKAAPAWNADDE